MKNDIFYKLPINDKFYGELSFGQFIELEKLKEDLIEAYRKKDALGFIIISYEILKIFGLDLGELKQKSPAKILESILIIFSENKISSDIKFLNTREIDKKEKSFLDYEYRFVFYWYHLVSRAYGWTKEYIDSLPFNFVLRLIQEILIDDFQTREWEYSLSELAYSYDSVSKKSKYVPLKKPSWLNEENYREIKHKVKLAKMALPFGNIVDTSGMGVYGEKIGEKNT